MAELMKWYAAVKQQTIDPHDYSGTLFNLVFDVVTAETFLAGIASKVIDGDYVEPQERAIVGRPVLTEGRWWHSDSGQAFDVQKHDEIRQVASRIEALRVSCDNALNSTQNS